DPPGFGCSGIKHDRHRPNIFSGDPEDAGKAGRLLLPELVIRVDRKGAPVPKAMDSKEGTRILVFDIDHTVTAHVELEGAPFERQTVFQRLEIHHMTKSGCPIVLHEKH